MNRPDGDLTPCVEVLDSLLRIIDGEGFEPFQQETYDLHLVQCSPCQAELSHESFMRLLLQDVLRRICCESAPSELHEALRQQIRGQMYGVSEVVTEFRMTEISIEIDEFGQIEHREITIEHTQEIRFPDENQ